jgi:hypothetical protein
MVELKPATITNGVMVSITLHKLGDSRKASDGAVTSDVDADRLKVTKKIIKCDEYDAIASYLSATKTWVLKRTLPTFTNKSTYWCTVEMADRINTYLNESQQKLGELVMKFLAVVPQQIEAARLALKGEFNEADYRSMEGMRDAFGIEWGFLSFAVPDALSPELRQSEVDKYQKKMDDAASQVRDALRVGMAKLIDHLVDRLNAKNEDKGTRFCDSSVNNLLEFLDLFSARNLTGDSALEELAVQAKGIISAATPTRLRDSRRTRDMIIEKMATVQVAVNNLIGMEKKRAFILADD